MPCYCAAPGCTNTSAKRTERKISFHRFPLKDKTRLQQWLINMRRPNFQVSRFTCLCSEHFTENNFEYQRFTHRRQVKKDATPTIFSYERIERLRNRKIDELEYHEVDEEEKGASNHEPAGCDSDIESNELTEANKAALLEISMNEKFYLPQQVEMLTKSKRKHCVSLKVVNAMREKLAAKILLQTLKKQMMDAEIKAAVAKREYFATKKATLSKMHNANLDKVSGCVRYTKILRHITVRLAKEKLSAKIEERVIRQQLEEAETNAANCEKEYYEAKRQITLDSNDNTQVLTD